jgi:hypothetical protein
MNIFLEKKIFPIRSGDTIDDGTEGRISHFDCEGFAAIRNDGTK